MENTIVDLFQLTDHAETGVGPTVKKSSYVSCIKVKGKPILPPLISEEKRNELLKYKQKAMEIELRIAQQKKKVNSQISSEISSISTLMPYQQSTPSRPDSLNLHDKPIGKTFVLSKSRTEGSLDKYSSNSSMDFQTVSSQSCSRNLDKIFKSTLEQRLASEEEIALRHWPSKYKQSPIIEEQAPETGTESDSSSSTQDRKTWSPLKTEPLNLLRIKLPDKTIEKDSLNSTNDSQLSSGTLTESPNLMRQNSYTLLTPSPALLNFLETQKGKKSANKNHSGRKTWDLIAAKKNWDINGREACISVEEEGSSDDSERHTSNKKPKDSTNNFPLLHNSMDGCSVENAATIRSDRKLDSNNSKKSVSKLPKMKPRVKVKKTRSKNVSSPKSTEKVPFKKKESSPQNHSPDSVPYEIKNELSDLSHLLLKMKVDHERQKRELEEKQQSEIKQLETLFKEKEEELLSKVQKLPRKTTKSIFSHCARNSEMPNCDATAAGDGSHNHRFSLDKAHLIDEEFQNLSLDSSRRPHSAKEFYPHVYSRRSNRSRRARSMDFNHGCQDTDLDFSFQDDFMDSRDTTVNNEYIMESDSLSNFSSRSSTVSSENRPDSVPLKTLKKFQGISSEEHAKYKQAATVITAAARGFLTRRLFKTAHVQSLITTLKDAIICATQIHTASDIAESDIDLMRRLGRQIEAAWDAVYSVFFNSDTSTKLQLIAADRERLRAAVVKTPAEPKKKRLSSATRKSLDRKKCGPLMSKSQTSNGSTTRVRMCSKMTASYPSPYLPSRLK